MINKFIDHTNLKVDANHEDIVNLCQEARNHDFQAVCVAPSYVSLASKELMDTDIKVCTVVGFPFGYQTTKTKVYEAVDACLNGADEIDVVINITKLKDNDREYLIDELLSIQRAIKKRILKVIIETSALNEEEKHLACEICNAARVDYVKTSTGYGGHGATVEDVLLIRSLIEPDLKIKASGGIKSFEDLDRFLRLGVTRIGTSHGVKILQEYEEYQQQEKSEPSNEIMIEDYQTQTIYNEDDHNEVDKVITGHLEDENQHEHEHFHHNDEELHDESDQAEAVNLHSNTSEETTENDNQEEEEEHDHDSEVTEETHQSQQDDDHEQVDSESDSLETQDLENDEHHSSDQEKNKTKNISKDQK